MHAREFAAPRSPIRRRGVLTAMVNFRGHTLPIATLILSALFSGRSFCQQTEGSAHALRLSGDVDGTHDPSIAEDHGTFYIFATGKVFAPRPVGSPRLRPGDPRPASIGQIPVRCSPDLLHWTLCGRVFPDVPAWIHQMSQATKDLWAPDISFFDGVFHLYYAFSAFGKNTSGIALATNETLDSRSPRYQWKDRGLVLQSTLGDNFNAIDPNLVLDRKGQPWLAFGSFWTGIKMRRLDRTTGLLSRHDTRTYSLAAREAARVAEARRKDLPPDSEAVEAPFVFRHGDLFYLFVSWDLCCRGVRSTYRTMVGRSRNVNGPYVDRDGKPMLEGGGTPLLRANGTWLGPGGASLLHLPAEDIVVFHAYSSIDGHPALQISTLAWKDGWPVAVVEGEAPAAGFTEAK